MSPWIQLYLQPVLLEFLVEINQQISFGSLASLCWVSRHAGEILTNEKIVWGERMICQQWGEGKDPCQLWPCLIISFNNLLIIRKEEAGLMVVTP